VKEETMETRYAGFGVPAPAGPPSNRPHNILAEALLLTIFAVDKALPELKHNHRAVPLGLSMNSKSFRALPSAVELVFMALILTASRATPATPGNFTELTTQNA
jgi:hypothetical protein